MAAVPSFSRIFRWIYTHTEGFLMVVFILMLLTDVLIGILARYVHFEVVFATELGKYIFIWLCTIGISCAAKDHQHIRLDFFTDKLSIPHKYSWIISQVFFLTLCLFFIYYGLQLTVMHLEMNKAAMGFRFPMFVFTAAIPTGFLLTAIRLILDINRTIRNGQSDNPYLKPET